MSVIQIKFLFTQLQSLNYIKHVVKHIRKYAGITCNFVNRKLIINFKFYRYGHYSQHRKFFWF